MERYRYEALISKKENDILVRCDTYAVINILHLCNVDESGNFQKPLKITSLKQIYLQIEKNIYTRTHSLSNALTHLSQTH